MKTATVRVGYAGLHMGVYYAKEYDQFGRGERTREACRRSRLRARAGTGTDRRTGGGCRRGSLLRPPRHRSPHRPCGHVLTGGPAAGVRRSRCPPGNLGSARTHPLGRRSTQLLRNASDLCVDAALLCWAGRPASNGRADKWFFGDVESAAFSDRLGVTIRALRAVKTLRGARIGLVGDVAPGFYGLIFDEALLRSRFGVEVVRHPIEEILKKAQEDFEEDAVRRVRYEMLSASKASWSMRCPWSVGAVYLALRELACEHDYRALAVRDWTEFQDLYDLSPLLSMAWLTERDGIPVACEGDV